MLDQPKVVVGLGWWGTTEGGQSREVWGDKHWVAVMYMVECLEVACYRNELRSVRSLQGPLACQVVQPGNRQGVEVLSWQMGLLQSQIQCSKHVVHQAGNGCHTADEFDKDIPWMAASWKWPWCWCSHGPYLRLEFI